jgi:hypothetical protein
MEILDLQEKVLSLSDEQMREVYSLTTHISLESIEELAPSLLNICLESGGKLKDELGRVIFHLQKTERLNTRIGFEKLLHGSLRVNAKETLKLLQSSEKDAKDLSLELKKLLKE